MADLIDRPSSSNGSKVELTDPRLRKKLEKYYAGAANTVADDTVAKMKARNALLRGKRGEKPRQQDDKQPVKTKEAAVAYFVDMDGDQIKVTLCLKHFSNLINERKAIRADGDPEKECEACAMENGS